MIPRQCKRLAEVDFPIAVVSQHSAGEKYAGKGYPNTLHLWWARRPYGACRAILLALLLPDPCDESCPADFRTKARSLLPRTTGHIGSTDEELRRALLRFIGDFADWDLASNPTYLEVSRGLVNAAHPEETPLVVDPFAGGGSIPVEALRLGCDTFASDLNPIASLILKVMLEDIPRHQAGLADELHRVGGEIKKAAERELAKFYPTDPDGARPIAYLWARTVRCETPNCGAEIPLARSFWLCKRANRKRALRYRVQRIAGETPFVDFEIFEPRNDGEVPSGTVSRAKATCLCCSTVLSPDRVRAQLRDQRGGADATFDRRGQRIGGACLLAVVMLKTGEQGRHYRLPAERDYGAVFDARTRLKEIETKPLADASTPVPDEPLPPQGTLGFRVQLYGMAQWGDLFTARQKLALVTLCTAVRTAECSEHTRHLLACAFDRVAMSGMSCTRWNPSAQKMQHTFGRQALPLVWDFAEVAPLADAPGNWDSGHELIVDVVDRWPRGASAGQSQLADACESPLVSDSAGVWFTDPPYYDAVPYADLADFFFVWLKRVLPGNPLMRDPFDADNPLTPKAREVVQDQVKRVAGRPKDRAFFENTMARAFNEGRRALRDDGVGCVVFAHKTTEGWEALLSGLVSANWTITGSWPISTEMGSRLRARDSAALETSVHLVCRPRPENAPVGDWADVLRELPKRVGVWMERLQGEGIRGADLVFACIGPALEIYSRYSRVVDAEEREIPLGGNPEAREPHERGYLAYVWEVVGRSALEQVLGQAESKARNGATSLEEDARLTALFLWTLQSTNGVAVQVAAAVEAAEEGDEVDEEDQASHKRSKGLRLPFDVVRRFAQPLGIHLRDWEHRIIETEGGAVHLLPVTERARQLFGEDGVQGVADRVEQSREPRPQLVLFPEEGGDDSPKVRAGRKASQKTAAAGENRLRDKREPTTLDRVHAAMLLQRSGRAKALRALLEAEQDRGPDFLRLANALSALYPQGSEEKRLLDAMLLAVRK